MTTLEQLVADFTSETGINLLWHKEHDVREVETLYGSTHDSIMRDTNTYREDVAVVDGFDFKIANATVSGHVPSGLVLGIVDVDTDEVMAYNQEQVVAAIKKVCGPINFEGLGE